MSETPKISLYNKERYLVQGDRKVWGKKINEIKGRWSEKLKAGPGWTIPIENKEKLEKLFGVKIDKDGNVINKLDDDGDGKVEDKPKEKKKKVSSRKDKSPKSDDDIDKETTSSRSKSGSDDDSDTKPKDDSDKEDSESEKHTRAEVKKFHDMEDAEEEEKGLIARGSTSRKTSRSSSPTSEKASSSGSDNDEELTTDKSDDNDGVDIIMLANYTANRAKEAEEYRSLNDERFLALSVRVSKMEKILTELLGRMKKK